MADFGLAAFKSEKTLNFASILIWIIYGVVQ